MPRHRHPEPSWSTITRSTQTKRSPKQVTPSHQRTIKERRAPDQLLPRPLTPSPNATRVYFAGFVVFAWPMCSWQYGGSVRHLAWSRRAQPKGVTQIQQSRNCPQKTHFGLKNCTIRATMSPLKERPRPPGGMGGGDGDRDRLLLGEQFQSTPFERTWV